MIYLFSNRSYGASFIDAAARYSRRNGVPVTLVLSGHRRRQREGGPVAALRSFASRWRVSNGWHNLGLPVLIVDDVNAPAFVNAIEPGDAGIIAGFDQIFRDDVLSRLKPFVNFHPSLLPYYRGPEPSYWCLENGETTTGFTVHMVTRRIDVGEIQYQDVLHVDPHEDFNALNARIANMAVPTFEHWLEHLASGAPWARRLVDAGALYKHHVDYASFKPSSATRAQ